MIVINALKTRAVGSATPDAAAAVQSEVDALLSRMPSLTSSRHRFHSDPGGVRRSARQRRRDAAVIGTRSN